VAGERWPLPSGLYRRPVPGSGGLGPGGPVLQRADRPLALAARARRPVGAALPGRLLGIRPPARFVRRGGMKREVPDFSPRIARTFAPSNPGTVEPRTGNWEPGTP